MTIEEELFKKTKINFNKLFEYGFKKDKFLYKYSKNIMDNNFRIDVEIDENGLVKGKIFDLTLNEEYTNFRVKICIGSFTSRVKEAFENLLKDIKNSCFITEAFIYEQSNRIAKAIKENMGMIQNSTVKIFQNVLFSAIKAVKNAME